MPVKEIERAKFDVNLAISLFLRVSECLSTSVKNGEIAVSHRDEIPSIEK